MKRARFRKKNILVGTKFLQKREIFQKLEQKKWNKKKELGIKNAPFYEKYHQSEGLGPNYDFFKVKFISDTWYPKIFFLKKFTEQKKLEKIF